MSPKNKKTIILFNPMPVKHPVAQPNKKTTSLAVSSMTCYQIRDGIDVCAAVKEKYPDRPVIWGGYHPTSEPGQTLESPFIDIVIRGHNVHA